MDWRYLGEEMIGHSDGVCERSVMGQEEPRMTPKLRLEQ